METVTMTHPTLPGHTATVPASAVPQHARAGWQPVEESPAPRRRRPAKTLTPEPAENPEPTTDAAPAAETPESET